MILWVPQRLSTHNMEPPMSETSARGGDKPPRGQPLCWHDDSVMPIDREAAWQDRDRATDSGTASRFLFADILQKSSDADLRFGIENGMG